MIKIHGFDETYVKLECEDDILNNLSDFFTFTVPNYTYKRGKKGKRWTGKIRLLDKRRNLLFKGLLLYLEQYCIEENIPFEYSDNKIKVFNQIDDDYIINFIKSLKLQSKGQDIFPYEHQLNSILESIKRKRVLIISPTSSGKSLIIYILVRMFLKIFSKSNRKILIIVPRVDLVEQLFKDFIDYSTANGWDTDKYCHRINQYYSKDSDKKVFISTWQSLHEMPTDYFKQFDVIVGDEAHLTTANSLKYIIKSCINASYRIAMTGTLDGTEVHQISIESLFGPIYTAATLRELIDKDRISDVHIKAILLKHQKDDFIKLDYNEEIEYLIGNEKRNNFICKLALDQKRNTLVLFERVVKHGQILFDKIKDMNKDGKRNIYFIFGGVESEDREKIRAIFEKENNSIIVASYGTYSMGTSINNLHSLILAASSAGRVRVLQSLGRSLRKFHDKEKAILFDIGDDIRYDETSENNYTLNHMIKRLGFYQTEQLDYKLLRVRI